jgi:hypothetical protein
MSKTKDVVESTYINSNRREINYDELCEYYAKTKNPSSSNQTSVIGGKKYINRKANTEEHSFFLWNMFYIFFLPYVCRIKPISDEDIPEPDSRDSSILCYNKTKDGWGNRYKKYAEELGKYEAEKTRDPKFFFTYYFYFFFIFLFIFFFFLIISLFFFFFFLIFSFFLKNFFLNYLFIYLFICLFILPYFFHFFFNYFFVHLLILSFIFLFYLFTFF